MRATRRVNAAQRKLHIVYPLDLGQRDVGHMRTRSFNQQFNV